ncbi:MAG: UDP-N-acetylmuramate dehydrogenase [Thermodesulfobacteriota bacterium]|nr:UDP-N-acetylmuramate dehydrogenase [Thermodesulfobacteriota bacterium]
MKGLKMALDRRTLDKLADFWEGEVLLGHPMSDFSTLRVGGPADAVVLPKTRHELSSLISGLHMNSVPFWVIGRGSNILVPDKGLPGVVIVLGTNFSKIEIVNSEKSCQYVRIEAGCSLARLVGWCVEHELTGLEFTCGIPGSVGGAVATNAGAWGKEIKEVVSSVTLMDEKGELFARERGRIYFLYRHCDLGRSLGHPEGCAGTVLVVDSVFRLEMGERGKIEDLCRQVARRRRESQPQGVAGAGSFFKNPGDDQAAGRLIEEAGLKGVRAGGAQVSMFHANFIVNTGDATGRDIFDLMHLVQEKVWNRSGIMLEPEIRILGTNTPNGYENGDKLSPGNS